MLNYHYRSLLLFAVISYQGRVDGMLKRGAPSLLSPVATRYTSGSSKIMTKPLSLLHEGLSNQVSEAGRNIYNSVYLNNISKVKRHLQRAQDIWKETDRQHKILNELAQQRSKLNDFHDNFKSVLSSNIAEIEPIHVLVSGFGIGAAGAGIGLLAFHHQANVAHRKQMDKLKKIEEEAQIKREAQAAQRKQEEIKRNAEALIKREAEEVQRKEEEIRQKQDEIKRKEEVQKKREAEEKEREAKEMIRRERKKKLAINRKLESDIAEASGWLKNKGVHSWG
ncbi:hypothetical protein HYV10_01175 [Candidatus Dependentiae bacterium]|nr:hypothetical protein [Candidatus Dependentiae bacterium]